LTAVAADSAATAAEKTSRETSSRGVDITRSRAEAPTGVVIDDDDTADNGDDTALTGLREEGEAIDSGASNVATQRGSYGVASAAGRTNERGATAATATAGRAVTFVGAHAPATTTTRMTAETALMRAGRAGVWRCVWVWWGGQQGGGEC